MANKFLKKYFNSLNKDEDELTAYEKALKKLKSTTKGSIGAKELEQLKKLLPDEDKYI